MITYLLLAADMAANTGAHICLKLSAAGRGVKLFLFWQVIGNLSGFVGVLAYTLLLRKMSLHAAYPLTEGLTAIGVQFVGGMVGDEGAHHRHGVGRHGIDPVRHRSLQRVNVGEREVRRYG